MYDREYYRHYRDMLDWANEYFGPAAFSSRSIDSEHTWSSHSTFGHPQFTFTKEKDATLFILRWGLGDVVEDTISSPSTIKDS